MIFIDIIINCSNNIIYTRVKRLNNNIITTISRKHFKTNNENLEFITIIIFVNRKFDNETIFFLTTIKSILKNVILNFVNI